MNIFFIVVCIILVGCVFVPFFLFNALGKNVQIKMNDEIKQFLASHHLNISQTEHWGDSYLGLDIHQKKLVYFKTTASESLSQFLDLQSVRHCQLVEKRKLMKIRDKKELVLEQLDLEFLCWNGDLIILNFYDESDCRMEDFEQARAEKWKTLITGYLLKIPIEKKVA